MALQMSEKGAALPAASAQAKLGPSPRLQRQDVLKRQELAGCAGAAMGYGRHNGDGRQGWLVSGRWAGGPPRSAALFMTGTERASLATKVGCGHFSIRLSK